jgi:hypothetical protein
MQPRRFVLLEHSHQGVHYDLMLEHDGVLRTWRLEQPPERRGRQPANLSFNHRLRYLDYEGPISGDRGHVRRWDAGTYQGDLTAIPPWRLLVHGSRLHGWLTLWLSSSGQWEIDYVAVDK